MLTSKQLEIELRKTPSYLKESYETITKRFKVSKKIAKLVVPKLAKELYKSKKITTAIIIPQLSPSNVLTIGDLHEPWSLDEYLDFCKETQVKYKCGKVVFMGDVIDGHSWSYHEKDVDGMSVRHEVDSAVARLHRYYEKFPEATCLLGNHDLLIQRKARTYGLSKKFIKDLSEVLEAPSMWNFVNEYVKDDVRYIHGSVGDAIKIAKSSRMSTVQGHYHTKAYIEWTVSQKDALFGMQVGCGVNHSKYAFEYSRTVPSKPIISCGVVLNSGKLPIIELMPL